MTIRSVLLASVTACTAALAAPPYSTISIDCKSAIRSKVGAWTPVTVTERNKARANKRGFDPVVAGGDFDGNGRQDQAVLLKAHDKDRLVVCLRAQSGTDVLVMEDVYCNGNLRTFPPGTEHEAFGSGELEVLIYETIGVACEDEPGPTYIYERGRFRQIVIDD